MISIAQSEQDDDIGLEWAPEEHRSSAPAPTDERDRCHTGFSSWSLEVACANAQRW